MVSCATYKGSRIQEIENKLAQFESSRKPTQFETKKICNLLLSHFTQLDEIEKPLLLQVETKIIKEGGQKLLQKGNLSSHIKRVAVFPAHQLPDELLYHIIKKAQTPALKKLVATNKQVAGVAALHLLKKMVEGHISSFFVLKVAQLAGERLRSLNLGLVDHAFDPRRNRYAPSRQLQKAFLSQAFEKIGSQCTNLEHFSLKYFKLDPGDLKNLPKGLKTLELWMWEGQPSLKIDHLPPALNTLEITFDGTFFHCADNFTQIQTLSLRASVHLQTFEIPPNITDLDLGTCVDLSPAYVQKLPPGLTCLNLSRTKCLDSLYLQKLPPGLTCLNLSWTECRDSLLPHLPKTLQKIDISHCSKLTSEGLRFLPESLKALSLAGGGRIKRECVSYVPLTLTKIEFWGMALRTEDLELLSPVLRSLKIERCENLNYDSLIKMQIFSSLQKLKLDFSHMHRSFFNRNRKLLDATLLKYLPASLTVLRLTLADPLNNKDLAYLPQGLLKLELQTFGLTDHCFAYLPPKLCKFHVYGDNILTKSLFKTKVKNFKWVRWLYRETNQLWT